MADNLTDFQCKIDWNYTATLEDGSALPTFLRFSGEENLLKVLPHAKNETGVFKVLLTATQ